MEFFRFRCDIDILNAMLKNACSLKDNDFVISILRKMRSEEIEPTEESIRLVEDLHKNVFRSLRTETFASKKMRNECFKLSREYQQWRKHFRADKPKVSNKSKVTSSTKDEQMQIGLENA